MHRGEFFQLERKSKMNQSQDLRDSISEISQQCMLNAYRLNLEFDPV